MRRYLVLPMISACLLAFASGQPALAGSSTQYAGKNSQGQKLRFAVDHTASGSKFDPIYIIQIVRCPVTGSRITIEGIFGGFQIPIKNGKFNFVLNGISDRLRWSGTITSTAASGKEATDMAAFDKQGGLQDCSAGSLPWTAHALAPGSSATAARGATYVVKVIKAPDGLVHYSITH